MVAAQGHTVYRGHIYWIDRACGEVSRTRETRGRRDRKKRATARGACVFPGRLGLRFTHEHKQNKQIKTHKTRKNTHKTHKNAQKTFKHTRKKNKAFHGMLTGRYLRQRWDGAGRHGKVRPSSNSVRRPVPSRPQKFTIESYSLVPSRRGRLNIPSRFVAKKCVHRPVPSRKITSTVPSRREELYLPPRPAVICFSPFHPTNKNFSYRPVPPSPSFPSLLRCRGGHFFCPTPNIIYSR